MEALGVASGIAGLIALAEIISFRGSKFYSRVKNARSDIRELLVEVQSLYGVLNSLKLLVTCLEDDDLNLKHTSCASLDHFQTCRKNLDLLKKFLDKLDLDSVKTKLLWPFKVSETRELIEKIGRNKRDLSDALTADGISTLLTALSTNPKILETVQNVQINFERFTKEWAENEKDEHRRKMYDWCSTANPYEKHRMSKALRHPNTVLWFFDSAEYTAWAEQPNAAIWLYGIPGAGKTILTSAVIEEAKLLAYDNPGYALAYYYCEDKSRDTQMVSNILGSLIRQLCAESEDAFNDLGGLYQRCHDDAKNPTKPSNEDFIRLLKTIFRHFECVMLIIDGLDECQIPDDRSNLLDILSDLNADEKSNLKIVCTSRDEIDIRSSFIKFDKISIAARGTDLELFVAATIETRIKKRVLRLRDPSLKEAIINGIVSKANGMFQWAKCQVDHVCILSTDKERRRALESLPSDLFETYKRILNRANGSTESNKSMVEKTLRWLAFSKDQLTFDELSTAVALHFKASSLDEDDLPDEDSVLWWCSSLVTKSESTNTLQLSHFTVKEFLMDDRLFQFSDLRRYHLSEKGSKIILGRLCLTYLGMDIFSNSSDRLWEETSNFDRFPLLRYAAMYWPAHCYAYEEDDLIYHLLLYNIVERALPRSAPTLHYAAAIGLTKVCEWLLEQNVDINRCDEALGTPLICALRGAFFHPSVYKNHMKFPPNLATVQLLLDQGAKGDAKVTLVSKHTFKGSTESRTYTPMSLLLDQYWATPDLVCGLLQVLLDAGVVSSFSYSTVWMTFQGSSVEALTIEGRKTTDQKAALIKTLKIMLAHPSARYFDPVSEEKMLSYIARNSTRLEDQSLVLERSAKEGLFNSTSSVDDLFKDAVSNGQIHLVTSLIERGATTTSISKALIEAVRSNLEAILRILMKNISFDKEVIYRDVQNACKQAAMMGWNDGIKIMIEHGVDVNMSLIEHDSIDEINYAVRNIDYATTLLRTAIIHGQTELVRFLLSSGVDLSLENDSADLLHLAVQTHLHYIEITELLIEKGIPTRVNQSGLSLLHSFFNRPEFCFRDEDEQFVRRLIHLGSPLDAVDKQENSLLHALLASVSPASPPNQVSVLEDIILIICDEGRFFAKQNNNKEIPLHIAIRRHLPSHLIEFLISEGQALKTINSLDRSVLHDAVSWPVDQEDNDIFRDSYQENNRFFFLRYGLRTLSCLLKIDGIIVDLKNEGGLTPLLAVGMNCPQNPDATESEYVALAIEKLLQYGAKVNAACPLGISLLHHLAAKGHIRGVKETLKFNPDIYVLTGGGDSPLDKAVAVGDLEIVRLLQAHDAADTKSLEPIVGRRSRNGYLPIHVAAWYEVPMVLRFLHQHGQQYLNEPTRDAGRETPLHIAVRGRDPMTVKVILELGAEINAINAMKRTPLHYAALLGLTEVVQLLLDRGADVLAEDEHGSQPWVDAALGGHEALSDLLLSAAQSESGSSNLKTERYRHCEVPGRASHFFPVEKDVGQEGKLKSQRLANSFLIALEHDDGIRICETLLRSGIDPNMILNKYKETATHIVSRSNSSELMTLLIRNGTRIDIRNRHGDLPIHLAASRGHCKALAVLLENGADVIARNSDMETSLHIASRDGYLEAVKMILEYSTIHGTKSALLEYRDYYRNTALMRALNCDDLDTSKYLIEQGANVHTLDCGGLTTLNAAACHGDKQLIETLLSCGVNAKKTFYSGINCLHILARRSTKPKEWEDHLEIGRVLINAGVDISSNNASKTSPLHAACNSGSKLLVEELLRLSAAEEIDVESSFYGTPLYAAAFRGHVEAVKVLLDAGAGVSKGLDSESPLQAAIAQGHEEVSELLKNSKQQDKRGCSTPGVLL